MTDFSDELTAKKAAISEARNSTKPTISAEQAILVFEANIAKVREVINRSKKTINNDIATDDGSEKNAKYEEPIQFH